ncbi:MAG: 16S rRNA (guanine(966)-N(2))-methyltransferase RsmD [Alphaproteobacteria bacterium]|nr:16S rRNA (guanine(966)-N(2))-methyltransferase RsmD [Alphaproteobacteria bacterium]
MRIVGGRLRGRSLATPKGHKTRPTSDRVREAIFNVLAHSPDAPPLEGARVIDLFAGTGALGLEAISRGANYALFVEDNASARALIQQNIETFGLQGNTRIFRRDATKLGPASSRDKYTFAFLDPPYARGLGLSALTALSDGGWLLDGALIVLEEHSGQDIDLPPGYRLLDCRTYSDTSVTFASYTSLEAGTGGPQNP